MMIVRGLALLADSCPNLKIHRVEDEWCLHPDAHDRMSYQHEDLLICINAAMEEILEKAEQASRN